MGHLIINKFDTHKISISESRSYYIISYILDYIKLSSIPIILHDVSIKEEHNGIYLRIHNKGSIQLLQDLDTYLKSKVTNYKSILHYIDFYYIFFKRNTYIESFLKTFNEIDRKDVIINIIKFKKHASHTYPIVYIL